MFEQPIVTKNQGMMAVVKNTKRNQFISVELEETEEGEPVKSATGIEEEGKQGIPCD